MASASAATYFVAFGVLALAGLVVNLGGLIAVAVECPANISWLFFFFGENDHFLPAVQPNQCSWRANSNRFMTSMNGLIKFAICGASLTSFLLQLQLCLAL
jgi:hypothetical protein